MSTFYLFHIWKKIFFFKQDIAYCHNNVLKLLDEYKFLSLCRGFFARGSCYAHGMVTKFTTTFKDALVCFRIVTISTIAMSNTAMHVLEKNELHRPNLLQNPHFDFWNCGFLNYLSNARSFILFGLLNAKLWVFQVLTCEWLFFN